MRDFDPTEDRSIPQVQEYEKSRVKSTPNLWKIPVMTKDLPPSTVQQLGQFQKTYAELLYSVGEKKYNLRRNSDFTVEIVIPEGNLSALGYQVVGGPIVHVVLPVCSVDKFEQRIHRILRDVKECLRSKSLEVKVKLDELAEATKSQVPVFYCFEKLQGHQIEVIQEQIVTITDKTTGVTVTRTKKESEEPYRIMIHRAKQELVQVNGLVEELKKKEKAKKEENVKQTNEVKV
jgi:hypothetical protein